ncbi:MAG: type IV pilin protein [Pseudomonadota bacterium]
MTTRQHGFSLIELMITVVILGILGTFAFSGYQNQVRQTKRADCGGALVSMSQAMERFYSVNNTYEGAAAGGNDTGAPAIFPTSCPLDSGNPSYNLTIANANPSTFLLQATPTGGQVDDECGSLTLSNTGAKNVTNAAAGVTWDECW